MQTLPAWAPKPQEGEYIGVSFPDNGEEQAISLALFSYVLTHWGLSPLCNKGTKNS